MEKIILNRAQTAKFFKCAPSVVDGWVDAGCPYSGGGGKGKAMFFDLSDVVEWLLARNKTGNVSEELEREKLRKLRRENDIEEKKFAPVELFQAAVERAANIQIPIFESLPLILKRNFPELSGDQIQLVKKAVAECRNAIIETRIDF